MTVKALDAEIIAERNLINALMAGFTHRRIEPLCNRIINQRKGFAFSANRGGELNFDSRCRHRYGTSEGYGYPDPVFVQQVFFLSVFDFAKWLFLPFFRLRARGQGGLYAGNPGVTLDPDLNP